MNSQGLRRACARLFGWRGAILSTVIVPLGVALAVGCLAAGAIPPRWVAGGLPYVTGYPKNVEMTATVVGVAIGAATALLAPWPAVWWAAGVMAGWGFGRALTLCGGLPMEVWSPALLVVFLLAAGLEFLHMPPPVAQEGAWTRGMAWLSVATLMAAVFVLSARALDIDVFHHGEVLLTATDLRAGGRPFVTVLWPHGLHDTGLAALWLAVTGKVGTSPVSLAYATNCAFGVLTLYLFSRNVIGSAAATAAACWAMVAGFAWWEGESAFGSWSVLDRLGMLVWFAAALHCAMVGSAMRLALAGAACAVGAAYRIEAGVFAVVGILAAIAYQRGLAPTGLTWARRAREAVRGAAWLAIGGVCTVAVAHAVLGWPDGRWAAVVFGELPHYHSIANGWPFPWPCAGRRDPDAIRLGTATLTLATVLLAAAARQVVSVRRASEQATEQRTLLVFLAVFAFLALRTALGRSDQFHFYWLQPTVSIALLLCASPWVGRLTTRPRMSIALTVVFAGVVAWCVAPFAQPRLRQLAEHLRPNEPVDACADRMFTATEAASPYNRTFIDATCRFEAVLRQHGISRLLIDHAAPWDYVRFGLPLPSPLYSLNRAYAPADQERFITDVRAAGVQALLQVHSGFGALAQYDVPNVYRVPIIEAYLRARRQGVPMVGTPLGRLYLWDEPPTRIAPAPVGAGGAADLAWKVDAVVFDPTSGFSAVWGAAADLSTRRVLAAIKVIDSVDTDVELTYHAEPPIGSDAGSMEGIAASGWLLVAHTPPAALAALHIRLVSLDGRYRDVSLLPLPPPRVLPPLSGPEWSGLRAGVEAAITLGTSDRTAAQVRP